MKKRIINFFRSLYNKVKPKSLVDRRKTTAQLWYLIGYYRGISCDSIADACELDEDFENMFKNIYENN